MGLDKDFLFCYISNPIMQVIVFLNDKERNQNTAIIR